MNQYQLLLVVQDKLRDRMWPASPSTPVFHPDSVRVTVASAEKALQNMIPPMALIRPGPASHDPLEDEEPTYIRCSFAVRLITVVAGDEVGENALMGGNAPSALTSQGQGLLEIEEQMFAAIALLNHDELVKVQWRASSEAAAEIQATDLGENYVCWRDYEFEAVVSTASS